MKTHRSLLIAAFAAGIVSNGLSQTTAFTYQGRLNGTTGGATGWYDLRFALWDDPSGGNKWGPTLTNSAVATSNGLFTTTIDFGFGVFTGGQRWMEISVRTNGNGAFSALTPRQFVAPTPYAIYANSAATAGSISGTVPSSGLAGTYTGALNFNNAANVFSGNGGGITNVNAASVGGLTPAGIWKTAGNGGTLASQFVGTTDNNPLTLKVNNTTALRIDPTVTVPNLVGGLGAYLPTVIAPNVSGAVVAGGNAPAGLVTGFGAGDFQAVYDSDGTVGGGFGNKVGTDNANAQDAPFATVAGGVFNTAANYAATVAGGDGNTASGNQSAVGGGAANRASGALAIIGGGLNNQATGTRATIGGGQNNLATNTHSAVAGGGWNTASGISSFIGGGGGDTFGGPWPNTAGGNWSAILGGWNNKANGYSAVVGGGGNNTAAGTYAVIPGGNENVASNYGTFAVGINARAVHDNSFVWSDGSTFSSTGNGQFAVRATGGARFATATTADSVAALNHFTIGPNGATNSALRLGFHTYNGISAGGVIQATDGLPAPLELNPMGGGGYLGGNWSAGGSLSAPTLDISGVARIQGANNWDVTGGEGDFRVGNGSYRFKIGVANGGGGAGDIWMRAHGGTARVFIKTPGGTTFYSNEGQSAGVTMAANGTSWASVSDRNAKKDFAPVDQRTILEKLAAMPITQWHYKWEDETVTPHIGPMAQDFKAAFYPGTDDKTITTQEADGVALAAIQGLNQKLTDKEAELAAQREQIGTLHERLKQLEQLVSKLAETK